MFLQQAMVYGNLHHYYKQVSSRRLILYIIVLFSQSSEAVHGNKCHINSIKSGYSLKHGTRSDNLKLLGKANNLEECKRLCCDTSKYEYGLFDGKKCYGIECNGSNDHKCTLIEDGNAEYSIFALKDKKKSRNEKDVHSDKKREDRQTSKRKTSNIINIHLSIDSTSDKIHKNESSSTLIPKSNKTNNKVKSKRFHRKHKNRRKHGMAGKNNNVTHNRFSRDYPYTYQLSSPWRPSTQKALNSRSILYNPGYPSAYNRNGIAKQRTIYSTPTSFQRQWYHPYTLYKVKGSSPWSTFQQPTSLQSNRKLVSSSTPKILNTSLPLESKKKSFVPPYNPIFDIMSIDNLHNKNHKQSDQISKKDSSIKSKEDTFKKVDVEMLRDLSTDNDDHTVVEKNAIPRPEDFVTEEKTLAVKDSTVDVPFSSNSLLDQPSASYLKGNKKTQSPLWRLDETLNETSNETLNETSNETDDINITSNIYSLLYPFSTIKRQTYQKRFLQRCISPLGVAQRSIIPDKNMFASSEADGFPAFNGRLRSGQNNTRSWCASPNATSNDEKQHLVVDFGEQTMFCRLGTQGNSQQKKWVEDFKLQFSDDGNIWEAYRENGVEKVFFGNKDEKDTTYQTLKNPILSRFVRFQPTAWIGDVPCLRVELFNTSFKQDNPTISERSEIPKNKNGLIEDLGFEKMDESVALDRSEYGNNGFLYGGSTVVDTHSSCRHGVQIPPGGDIVFDGTIMKSHPREAITIASWVKVNKVEGVHSIFDTVGSHSNHNFGQFHFEIVGGDIRWFHRNETGVVIFNVITTEKLIKPNEWNHLTVTYDATTKDAVIYINGTEQVRGKGDGLLSKDWNQRVGIGRHKGSRFLDGEVDEFKLYDSALDKNQVADLSSKCDFSKYYCGGTLTDNTGTIVSPGFPSTFRGSVECTWNIQGLPGEVVVLDMKQFKLGSDNSCGKANLEVRDALNDSVIGTFCGAALAPRKVISHSNRMYLKYTTDGALDGEMFKLEYYREKKRTSKKTLSPQCKSSNTLENMTLLHGVHSGEFTELGTTTDMDDCKSRCCDLDGCNVAFLIDNNCYSVKCASKDSCRVRKAKKSKLNPRLSFVRQLGEVVTERKELDIEDVLVDEDQKESQLSPQCAHQPALENVTLVGGIKSGNFTSHGSVDNMTECIQHCCHRDDCDLAFMVKDTCFSLNCINKRLCDTKPAKPSAFRPMVAYMNRFKLQENSNQNAVAKGKISTKTKVENGDKASDGSSTCNNMRVSKVFRDVTLNGGTGSGDFSDKGHVDSMEECVTKCCDADNCNVAFVIKDTCFLVKCKSYEDCGLKSAISEYYNPKIAYINWSPPKESLGESVPYTYKGCWRDFDITAFAMPLMEGTDDKLNEPYKKRPDPVNTCAKVSQDRGYKVFAVQNGGACFSGPDAEQTYKRYGESEGCKAGKGGPFANSVYKSYEDASILSLGCWSDLKDRAFRRMEKNDALLKNNFQLRPDPIATCAKVAKKMGRKYFALQKGGQCFVGKSSDAQYEKYSPSRKCKYGLGGQMANDVYMLKQNFSSDVGNTADKSSGNSPQTESSASGEPIAATPPDVDNPSQESRNQVEKGEVAYKEEADGGDMVSYLYKVQPVMSNVTLTSAIMAGTFVDRGKMASINDCTKKCGESDDCNVAFMLSSQCFSVHCFTDDSCKNKPAFSSFYNPQLAYVKHRKLRRPKNNTAIRTLNDSCKVRSELSNVTFIEGIKAGDFTDMGHVSNFDECKSKCCDDSACHIAFKIERDCYGVSCYNRDTCKTRPAKNADVFQPEMALLRPVKDSVDEKNLIANAQNLVADTHNSIGDTRNSVANTHDLVNDTQPVTTTVFKNSENETTGAASNPSNVSPTTQTKKPLLANCSSNDWNNTIIFNHTLVGGINAGDFREHGRQNNMRDCMSHCCSEEDCDLSFMIDHDCYTVKCSKPELCKTRMAKSTSFVPQIAFKIKPSSLSIVEAFDFVKDTLTELTLDKENIARPFKVLYTGLRATAVPPTNTPRPTRLRLLLPVKNISRTITDNNIRFNTDNILTSFYQREHTTEPSSNHSVLVHSETDGVATPILETPKKHSCEAGEIIHNATLRLGMHSGQFTKIGHVTSMDDCIESCCRSSNTDVAYMLGKFCFAVRCKTKEMCKPSPAMYSDIKSLNLNPAISFLNKVKISESTPDDDVDILASTYNKSIDSDDLIHSIIRNLTTTLHFSRKYIKHTLHDTQRQHGMGESVSKSKMKLSDSSRTDAITREEMMSEEGTCSDSPITYNVTLRGGVHSGKFTELGNGIEMRECVGRCCNTPLCDVAFMFSQKCYAVGCYDESKCQAVLAKPSALNPKLAYVSKYRSETALTASNGIGFRMLQNEGQCGADNLLHGPVYTNRTLLGGMKAGNFSYLGQAKDIKSCLSKCCSNDGCDLAYLVNKDQCFSVKCYSPELCQVTDKYLHNRMIEISKLIKPKNKFKMNRGVLAAYFAIGLLTTVVGVSGILWAVMMFVKRKRLQNEAKKQTYDADDAPRPDR